MQPRSFREVLRELRAEREWSLEDLAFETRRHGERGLSVGYLGQLERGARPPTLDAIEVLAGVLGIDAFAITEYRLGLLRRALDPREVGLEHASDLLGVLWPLVSPEEEQRHSALAAAMSAEVDQLDGAQQEEADAASAGRARKPSRQRAAG